MHIRAFFIINTWMFNELEGIDMFRDHLCSVLVHMLTTNRQLAYRLACYDGCVIFFVSRTNTQDIS